MEVSAADANMLSNSLNSTPFSVKNLLNLTDQTCALDFPQSTMNYGVMGHSGYGHGGMDGLSHLNHGGLSIDAVVNHVVNSSCEYGGSGGGGGSGMLQQPGLHYPSLTELNQGGMLRLPPGGGSGDYHLPPHSLSPPVSSPSPISQQCRDDLVRELTSLDKSKYFYI